VRLKRPRSTGGREKIAQMNEVGIVCDTVPLRVYPEGDSPAHVVGFVNATGVGFHGVEGYHDDKLRPITGVREIEQDPAWRRDPFPAREGNPARPGTSLILPST